ncbi:MAG: hybrid sensor histidine kinase/response regulator [Thermoflexales bacterium]|nr:hybrid sensor histidine kinase/response regulator [Thermoflexales bacterium]
MEKIKILLVEDDLIDQMAFERMIEREKLPYDYTIAGSIAQARRVLESGRFDIILMDYLLGDGTAFDVLESVAPTTPVIFVTGSGDEETAVKAMKAGAHDYLVKDPERNYTKVLPLSVEHVLQRAADKRAVEELREEMIRMMVHDLRNPLGAIYTALQVLDMDAACLAPGQNQAIQIATHNAQRMLELINSILDVSQLESGQLPVNYAPVELDALLAEVMETQAPLAERKAIELESDVLSSLPPAWADAGLIRRVLQNLVGNAIKFTPDGGAVRVRARLEELEGHPAILISVSDTGGGIPPEIRDRLFKKFVAGKQKGRGSGLGLAFCKLVLEAHGGRIWVEDKPSPPEGGNGATFTFSLPIASQDVV